MKLSSYVYGPLVVLASFALVPNGAVAAAKVKSHSNTNNNRIGGCPGSEAWDTTTNKCAAPANTSDITTRYRPGNNKASMAVSEQGSSKLPPVRPKGK